MDRHSTQDPNRSLTGVSRRRLIAGAGAGAAVIATGVVGVPAAGAAIPKPPGGDGTDHAAHPAVAASGSPITTTIASPPVSGWTYRTVSMYAFKPFDPAAQPTWGGSGVYPAVASTALRAEFEIPAGTLVREIEYYVYNASGSNQQADAYLYVPGSGTISSISAGVSIPSGPGITANRVVVPPTSYGPYPVGSALLASIGLPSNGTVQINGVRVGFSNGAGDVGLLSTPLRAYDSRTSGGRLIAGTTRTITLPSSVVAPGVTGVLVNVTATNAASPGYLKVYPASGAVPAASAINFVTGTAIANAVVVGVSNGRQVKIFASATTHVILDITGTVS